MPQNSAVFRKSPSSVRRRAAHGENSRLEIRLADPETGAPWVPWSWLGERIASLLVTSGLAAERVRFPWTWLIRLEDLPRPIPMVESLAAGGVRYLVELAALLGGPAPLAAAVRQELTLCCCRLGVDPGEPVPEWWGENREGLDEFFGGLIHQRVLDHLGRTLPAAPLNPASWPARRPPGSAAGACAIALHPVAAAPVLTMPAPARPAGLPLPEETLITGLSGRGRSLWLTLARPLPLRPEDRVWLWARGAAEPVCYVASQHSQGAEWEIEGVAGLESVFAAAIERGGVRLGVSRPDDEALCEVIAAAEGWESTALWLRWCRWPLTEAGLRTAVARRVRAEPEATLAAWLSPRGPEELAFAAGEAAGAAARLVPEFLADWRPDAEEAEVTLRACGLLGADPGSWVRLADAHPVLLGQLLRAGLGRWTAEARRRLLATIGDRLTEWIAGSQGETESQWSAAESSACRRAAAEMGLPEWWFTARARGESLADWVNGRPVPAEVRVRWRNAWKNPACRQWTAMRVLRELLVAG